MIGQFSKRGHSIIIILILVLIIGTFFNTYLIIRSDIDSGRDANDIQGGILDTRERLSFMIRCQAACSRLDSKYCDMIYRPSEGVDFECHMEGISCPEIDCM